MKDNKKDGMCERKQKYSFRPDAYGVGARRFGSDFVGRTRHICI